MKGREIQTKVPAFFLFILAVFCWAGTASAFEAWNGELTANVNLRRSPGLKGKIITGLEKGDKVLIRDRHEEWYKIVLERETYGYKGWVYGVFIKRTKKAREVEKRAPVFSERHILKTPLAPEMPERTPPLKREEKPLLPVQVEKMSTSEKVLPLVGGREKIELSKVLPSKSLSENKALGGPGTAEKEKMPDLLASSHEKTAPLKEFPVVGKTGKGGRAMVDISKSGMGYQMIGILIRFLMKLSPLALSCLALFLALKAVKMAKRAPVV